MERINSLGGRMDAAAWLLLIYVVIWAALLLTLLIW